MSRPLWKIISRESKKRRNRANDGALITSESLFISPRRPERAQLPARMIFMKLYRSRRAAPPLRGTESVLSGERPAGQGKGPQDTSSRAAVAASRAFKRFPAREIRGYRRIVAGSIRCLSRQSTHRFEHVVGMAGHLHLAPGAH